MDLAKCLPFKVGDEVESRSFTKGYLGAWFRSKIKKIGIKNNRLTCSLKYIDYPDEATMWTRMYQVAPEHNGTLVLVCRPRFPKWYLEKDAPNQLVREVTAIVDGNWKVGDLVDCRIDGSYWSAKIIGLLADSKARVKMMDPPIGEGEIATVNLKQLRPSLEWNIMDGWTVPNSMEGAGLRHVARLLHPNQNAVDEEMTMAIPTPVERINEEVAAASKPSKLICDDLDQLHIDAMATINEVVSAINSCGELSSPHDAMRDPMEMSPQERSKDEQIAGVSVSRDSGMETDSELATSFGSLSLEEMKKLWMAPPPLPATCEPLDAAILQLMELGMKVRWLKGLLEERFGHCSDEPLWRLRECPDS